VVDADEGVAADPFGTAPPGSLGGCVVGGWSAGCGVGWAGGSDAGCDGTGGVLLGGSGAGCCPGGCGLVLGGVVDGDCALPTAGRPSTAAVARVVVHRVIERFIRAPPEHGVDENEAFSVRSVLKLLCLQIQQWKCHPISAAIGVQLPG
jgi:hypothetical protein